MFKFAVVIFAVVACVAAKPGLLAAPAAAIVGVPAPVVTATSSQVFARNYNGIATAPVIAPVVKAVAAPVHVPVPVAVPAVAPLPLAAAPLAAYRAAPLAYSAPLLL